MRHNVKHYMKNMMQYTVMLIISNRDVRLAQFYTVFVYIKHSDKY